MKTYNLKIHTLLKGYLEMYAGLGYKLDKLPSRPTILQPNNEKDTWVLLYLTDGNTNFGKVYDILRPFILANLSKINPNPVFKDVKTSVAFFNDADDGLEKAIKELQSAIDKAFKKVTLIKDQPLTLFQSLPKDAPITLIMDYQESNIFQKQGYYILCKDDKTGKLEDIILPMMEQNNEEVFEQSKIFAQNNAPKTKDEDNYLTALKFDLQKATIGIAGQISIDNTKEKSKSMTGYANAVIIQKSNYLTEQKIKNNAKCQEIIDFINKMTDI
jgi:hypothetical protein